MEVKTIKLEQNESVEIVVKDGRTATITHTNQDTLMCVVAQVAGDNPHSAMAFAYPNGTVNAEDTSEDRVKMRQDAAVGEDVRRLFNRIQDRYDDVSQQGYSLLDAFFDVVRDED